MGDEVWQRRSCDGPEEQLSHLPLRFETEDHRLSSHRSVRPARDDEEQGRSAPESGQSRNPPDAGDPSRRLTGPCGGRESFIESPVQVRRGSGQAKSLKNLLRVVHGMSAVKKVFNFSSPRRYQEATVGRGICRSSAISWKLRSP